MSSLSPFENLEIIRGRTKRYVPCKDSPAPPIDSQPLDHKLSIIQGCHKISPFFFFSSCCICSFGSGSRSVVMTQLNIDYLGLRSLKEISDGDVVIIKNQNLCYTTKSHWKRLFKSESQSATIEENDDVSKCGKLINLPTLNAVRPFCCFCNFWLRNAQARFNYCVISKLDNYAGKISPWDCMFVFSSEEQHLWQEVYHNRLLGPGPGHVFRLSWLQPWWELCWLLQHPGGVREEFGVYCLFKLWTAVFLILDKQTVSTPDRFAL